MKRETLTPRELMERAVEVMQQSIHEGRPDAKVCPNVGAVLLKSDGSIETAFRSELRDGDHAEYTLLERKNRDNRLDGAVLYATLEPCAPDSRHPPKLSCAERIVLARIKEVWIGIEDPDPTVDRKGIKFLQDSGVTVHMFDRDLQEEIQKRNRRFISQAQKRAEAAKKTHPQDISLSPLEGPSDVADLSDLDPEALKRYRIRMRLANAKPEEFDRLLERQGILKVTSGRAAPTGFGLLLFGERPRSVMPQAGLLATIEYATGEQEIENFDGPMVLVPERVEKWLSDKLPNVIDRSRMQRKVEAALPFEMVREGVVNALVHRDYSIDMAKSQLVVTVDTIEIRSPGLPVSPITLDQLKSFEAPMLSRNPLLHYVFAQMEIAEERGLGLRSLRNRAYQLRLPQPTYKWTPPYLVLTLYRHPGTAPSEIRAFVISKLSPDEKSVLAFISAGDRVSTREVTEVLNLDERKAQRILKRLAADKLILVLGKGPATRYEVVQA